MEMEGLYSTIAQIQPGLGIKPCLKKVHGTKAVLSSVALILEVGKVL